MKVCSECQRCYDDSIANCSFEDHGTLTDARDGDCTLVEGYEINSQIESDSPVELFRATHLDSKKSVLIRIIKADNSSAELRNEMQSYANISHPNLAPIFECGELENKEVYVVSEDLEGQTLRESLNKFSKFTEFQAIKIAKQIAVGLEKLHDSGLLHRNLNPTNIYLKETKKDNFEVKLNYPDFGGIIEKRIVQDANGINAKSEIFEYYSPEQFSDKEIDFKSDLYSLAIVFYEMLLGRTPYELLSPQAIKEYIFNENDVDKLHHDLRALIAYSLRESLHQRLDIRPHSTNKMVRQLRHLELVATPSDFVVKEEESLNEPKWMGKTADREKVIEELKQSPSMLKVDETVGENTPKYEKVILSETEHNLEEVYLTSKNHDDIYYLEKDQIEFIDDLEPLEQTKDNRPSINPIATNTPSNSYIFKKSHVYIAGALATILFGSFFLITFYNWQSVANSNEAKLPEQQTEQKSSEKTTQRENDEVAESQLNENVQEEDDTSFDMTSRENFERERGEKTTDSTAENKPKSDTNLKTEQAKSVNETEEKEQPVVEKSPEKKLFEDTIITVGNNQKNTNQNKKDKNTNGEKSRKVFSDVVITY